MTWQFPADQTVEQAQPHRPDHRPGDQEGERHPQRYARRHEADEQRHRRARTERREHAQQGGQRVARDLALARQNGAGLFRAEPAAQHAGDEHDAGQQQQHLGHVIDEKGNRLAGVAVTVHREQRCHEFRKRDQLTIGQIAHDSECRNARIPLPVGPVRGLLVERRHAAVLWSRVRAASVAWTMAASSGARSGLIR